MTSEYFGTFLLEKTKAKIPDVSFHFNLLPLCIAVPQINILNNMIQLFYAKLISVFNAKIKWYSYSPESHLHSFLIWLQDSKHYLVFLHLLLNKSWTYLHQLICNFLA